MNNIKVSILIPTYNRSQYILSSIKSALSQTHKNIEIIVYDDGSTDNTYQFLRSQKLPNNVIIYKGNVNRGVGFSRNFLMDKSTGDYLCWLDSDDLMDQHRVDMCLKYMVSHSYDVIYTDIQRFVQVNTNGAISYTTKIHADVGKYDKNNFESIINNTTCATAFFKKELIINKFPDDITLGGEDVIWIWKILQNDSKIGYMQNSFYLYRSHNDRIGIQKTKTENSKKRNLESIKISEYIKSISKYQKEVNIINNITNENIIKSDQIQCIVTTEKCEINPFNSVKKMIISKFSNDINYNNCVVILGYNVGKPIDYYRKMYPNKKIIIYQLEQLYGGTSNWWNFNSTNQRIINNSNLVKNSLKDCDEIWDYDIDNIEFLKDNGFENIKHIPLLYTEELIHVNYIDYPKYDILFYGSINDRRIEYLSKLVDLYKVCIIPSTKDNITQYRNHKIGKCMVDPQYDDGLYDYIFNSKIIVNIHYYESMIQEQVRIFELLINNKIVVSEKSRINYFNNMIYEFNDVDDMISIIDNILSNNLWKSCNISELFKIKSYNNKIKIGAAYNTFYGLELIEESINSIRKTVDYIVLVHQKYGFDGKAAPIINQGIIKHLLESKLIDDIIYYDIIDYKNKSKCILEKRNIGLEYCIKNGCNYIMSLDTDELYDSDELLNEVKYMHENDIDTLYSPIYSYYYDRNHYFIDSYYVPSVYKINDMIFKKIPTSVLVDPHRKMDELKYKISEMPMHHYTYLKDTYCNKINRSFMTLDPKLSENVLNIHNYLLNWEEGNPAYVHKNNTDGSLYLDYIELKKLN